MSKVLRKVGAFCVLLVMWVVLIPLTCLYSLVFGVICMTSPAYIFNLLSNEFSLYCAWDVKQIKKALLQ